MTQLTADTRMAQSPWAAKHPGMRAENITMPSGSGSMLANTLLLVGLLGIAITFLVPVGAIGKMGIEWKHALASYHVGAITCLAASLGALFWLMIFHLTNSGWTGTVRKQFENVASLTWLGVLLVAVTIGASVLLKDRANPYERGLFSWMSMKQGDNVLLDAKAAYLNIPFFLLRAAIYAVVWIGLSGLMTFFSAKQDAEGGSDAAARARFVSAPGMFAFALTVAFAGFDWLKSVDFSFYSTMWGVYFFAGCALTSISLVTMIHALIRRSGKLEGIVTVEHFHDMGKLMFAFTVFWAYIAFFQYFLIWYANIPEETAWFIGRKSGGWENLFYILCIGHFAIPFLVLIFRPVKKVPSFLILAALWMIAMEVLDVFYMVRPAVYAGAAADARVPDPATTWWYDAIAIIGVLSLYGSFVVRKVCSSTLVALHDPRMNEALHHKNYV